MFGMVHNFTDGIKLFFKESLVPSFADAGAAAPRLTQYVEMHAYRAIQNGDADTIAIVYGNNQVSAFGRTLGTGGMAGRRGPAPMPRPMAYEAPVGLTLVGSYAMHAKRHMHEYGTTSAQLAEIAVGVREFAGLNPNAMHKDPITVDDVLESRMIV